MIITVKFFSSWVTDSNGHHGFKIKSIVSPFNPQSNSDLFLDFVVFCCPLDVSWEIASHEKRFLRFSKVWGCQIEVCAGRQIGSRSGGASPRPVSCHGSFVII